MRKGSGNLTDAMCVRALARARVFVCGRAGVGSDDDSVGYAAQSQPDYYRPNQQKQLIAEGMVMGYNSIISLYPVCMKRDWFIIVLFLCIFSPTITVATATTVTSATARVCLLVDIVGPDAAEGPSGRGAHHQGESVLALLF